MMRDRKGFTLVGLIVGGAILAFILTFCTAWIINDMKAYKSGEKSVLSQDSAQTVLNRMSDTVLETGGINKVISAAGNNCTDSKTETAVSYIELDGGAVSITLDTSENLFTCRKGGGKVFEVGNIESCKITPLPSDRTFKNCSGIRIDVKSVVGNKSAAADTYVYFRN